MRFPDFFIVGAPRSGTTSLYKYLKQNPKIFMPKRKESHYFSPNIKRQTNLIVSPIKTEKEYLSLFAHAREDQIIGEGSVTYFMDPDSPGAIHAKNPNAKIIMILRNPNERLISDYLYQIKYALDILPFEEVVKAGIRSLSKDIHSIVKTGIVYLAVKSIPPIRRQHEKRYQRLVQS